MKNELFLAALASALFASAVGCVDQTTNPIVGGPSSSSSSSSSGSGTGGGTPTPVPSGGSGGASTRTCSPACGDGEVCVEATCHAVVKLDSSSVQGCTIVLDQTHVYWASNEVRIVSKSGGDATGFNAWVHQPAGLAVDDTYLYFAALGQGLERAKKDGKSGMAGFSGGAGSPRFTVSDGSALYYNEAATDSEPPSIYTTPTSTPVNPAMDPAVFSDDGYGIGTVAVDATSVYYWSGQGLVKKNKTTLEVTPLYAPSTGFDGLPDDASGIIVDGDTVYYSVAPETGQGGLVSKVSTAGGNSTILVDGSLGASGVFAIDATDVYFMTVSAVMKMPKAGGTPVVVSPLDPPSPFATCMAADDTYVYWVDGENLMRYTK